MKWTYATVLAIVPALAGFSGCGNSSSTEAFAGQVEFEGKQFLLDEEPDGAIGVIAAREYAEDGAPLVLVGRIGGTANPWIENRAAFTVLDASLGVVADGTESGEGEICLDDCCAEDRLNSTALIKVVDGNGQVVPVDSRKLLGLREADMVVIQGVAKKDSSGGFSIQANRVFVRK